tara:strand:+ start:54 stop:647 length:594 start_codon:yes stop_codon:yes gene_type:complete
MQPAGFKETAASIKPNSTQPHLSFDGLSPSSKLGHLGASLGNAAFHTVASQQQRHDTMDDVSAHAVALTSRFQSTFQNQMQLIQDQRQKAMSTAAVHAAGGSGGDTKTTRPPVPKPTTAIPSMADMMKKKDAAQATEPVPVALSVQQDLFFKTHPDLYKEFQQQQADLIDSKKDGDAVKKALFGSLAPPPPPPSPRK